MKREKLPEKRLRTLIVIMAIWGVAIAARLYFLQVVESSVYVKKAAQTQRKTVETTPRRGDILDRDGNVLATSVEVDSVFAQPGEIKDPARTARVLSSLTGISLEEMSRRLDPDENWVWLKRKIKPEVAAAIERAKLPGIGLRKEFRRFYPHLDMASHLLGYVDIDEEGRTGLERSYNGPVRGQSEKILVLRDGLSNIYQRQQAPQAGANLTTTIDGKIQFIVHKELLALAEKTHAAAISIVVMDPNSGAILAMANYPAFNPNKYGQSSTINPSVSLTYEPGSTFKMVTIAAALEEGLTTPDKMIFCENGAIYVHGRRIKDHEPYGWLSVREIMQNSSNVGTIKLALLLGNDRLKNYANRYGFGQKTGIDLPVDAPGTVRDTSKWTKTSIASVAIGQEISVTPLQIVSMAATVANGGTRYRPYVVQKIQDPGGGTLEIKPQGERAMSATTAQQLREMLEYVVTDGTAKASQLEGYRAAGKTGTAEKIDPATGRYTKYVASFVGFAPVTDPQLAIVVVVDEPKGQYYGAQVAAPSFKRIAEQALRIKSVPPDVLRYAPHHTFAPKKKKDKPSSSPGAKSPEFKVLDASLKAFGTGEASVPRGFGEVVVPDFRGRSLREAMAESDRLGLMTLSTGSGRVIGQSPPPGELVKPGARIRFQLSLR